MELKAVVALTPGNETAEDVLDHKGNVILKKDTVLDRFMIQKLMIANLTCIMVKEPEDYVSTYFEKIRVSKTFAQFYDIYGSKFVNYREIMEQFLIDRIMPDPKVMLNIIDSIISPFKHSKITLLDMLTVLETPEQYFLFGHAINVALICSYTAKWFKLDDKDKESLILSGFYYDIGKFMIPSEILNKQGKLTDAEFNTIKSHTLIGYQMIQNLDMDPRIKLAALQHHEKIDGTGYPQGLSEDKISSFAKILAILDSYEAMTSYRSYRAPLCPFKVIEIFEKDGYGKYDTQSYMIFLERMVEEYIGKEVQLNDGTVCNIVLINKQKFSRPMVRTTDGNYIDLSKEKNLFIESLI